MKSNAVQITAEQLTLVQRLLKEHLAPRPYRLFLFGSRAKGTARANSDLDLMIDTPDELGPIRGDLNEAFEKSELPFKVDLVEKLTLGEAFKKNINDSLVELKIN